MQCISNSSQSQLHSFNLLQLLQIRSLNSGGHVTIIKFSCLKHVNELPELSEFLLTTYGSITDVVKVLCIIYGNLLFLLCHFSQLWLK